MLSVYGDHAVLVAVSPDDHHRPGLDDEEVVVGVSFGEQHFARSCGADRAERAQLCALVIVEAREGAVAVSRLLDPESEQLTHTLSGTMNATSSTKHQDQSSPRSTDVMIGCSLSRAWRDAWRLGDESQQPTFPHVRQTRKCIQVPPIFRHSSQPSVCSGRSTRI